MWIYNLGLVLYVWAIALASPWHRKAKLWIDGRKGLFRRMKESIDPSARIIWIHAASLGEFEQGRPLIEKIRKEHPEYKILLTFFSPSGYEIRKNYDQADYIFYLPIDTPRKARRFLDIAHPEIAIFVKYEFWINLLTELRRRSIRSYIVSAIFRRNSIFFRPYGGYWRMALESFDTIFVQNNDSKKLLAELGFDNVVVAGDTRFDRVAEIAAAAKKIDLIERFKGGTRLLIAGSTWGPDEDLLIRLINDNPSVKFIVAPHEMDESRINRLLAETLGGAVRYTQCTAETSFDGKQLLVLDTVGILSSAYGYAEWGYIGRSCRLGHPQHARSRHVRSADRFRPQLRKIQGSPRPGNARSGNAHPLIRRIENLVHPLARRRASASTMQPHRQRLHDGPPRGDEHRPAYRFRKAGIGSSFRPVVPHPFPDNTGFGIRPVPHIFRSNG